MRKFWRRRRFASWLLLSPEHVNAYLRMTLAWEVMRGVTTKQSVEELVGAARRE
jgi:ferric-dicitrate binding protein FerR (iron transport regulator)